MNSFNGSIHNHYPQTRDENSIEYGPVGSDLIASDFTELESRWIDRAMAIRAGLRRADSHAGAEIVGRKTGNYAGIVIPYFHPGSDRVREYRLRRDQPDLECDFAGNLKPRQKYLSPPGRSNMLYVVPGVSWDFLRDAALPIVIIEGEFKTLALWRLSNHGLRRLPVFCRWEFQAFIVGAEP